MNFVSMLCFFLIFKLQMDSGQVTYEEHSFLYLTYVLYENTSEHLEILLIVGPICQKMVFWDQGLYLTLNSRAWAWFYNPAISFRGFSLPYGTSCLIHDCFWRGVKGIRKQINQM